MDKNPKVDQFINNAKQWRDEFVLLREIALSTGLNEALKWGKPCYTLDDNNIIIIQGFKEYCALLFPKGVLLKAPQHSLIAMTENTQAARQLRFISPQDISEMEHVIKAYIYEAIEVERAGLKVPYKETSQFEIPEEFQKKLDASPELKSAFKALTPGRQRGYLLYFAQAKQSKTREDRIDNNIDKIMNGKGLNDR
jgi:uncharacterized protein YdeI (YjbR/CyaY-like superfamily)